MKTLFWRLATLALRLPSPQLGLTSVFGMRTGVTRATNHQNKIFNDQICSLTTEPFARRQRTTPLIAYANRGLERHIHHPPAGGVRIRENRRKNHCHADSQNSFREFCRRISTPRLKRLLSFHLVPINVVISHGPQRFLILGLASRLDAFSGYPIPT